MPEPTELTYAQCRELLGSGVLGRVAFRDSEGLSVIPVNYSIVNEAVIFRTSAYSTLAQIPQTESHDGGRGYDIAFEVDHLEPASRTGWSVLARGHAELVDDEDELAVIKRTWDPEPWASGSRPVYIRLRFKQLTGRRLGER
jgi:nitroimidazol reductase NimA-like FMN-containing flavoprotein (pyridoxamine 5'-phosphate oxidase superfamily)